MRELGAAITVVFGCWACLGLIRDTHGLSYPHYELFLFEPKIWDKSAEEILSRVVDWGDLVIAIHEVRKRLRQTRFT